MDNPKNLGTRNFDLAILSEILKAALISSPLHSCIPLKGGANNQVFQLQFKDASSLILKSYFQHPQDQRPRLQAEFDFLTYAWEEGIRSIPQPLYQDPSRNFALYTHLDASLATPNHSNLTFVQVAASFLKDLNRQNSKGQHLLLASEACLKISDFIQTVETRLSRLLAVSDLLLQEFLANHLIPNWMEIKESICKTALHILDPDPGDQIITPSDFGLHNVLVTPDNRYYFIDFEYAGWDDPAKTICDFFLQPKIPISLNYFDSFANAVASLTPNREKTIERAKMVFPICKIKWCCIILNVFLKTGQARREFSQHEPAGSRERQLEMAADYLINSYPARD